jgi:energy-coupling factor transporter ATP-binding protein EcfA2
VPQINYLLIQLFIFVYHFSQEENINKISERLDLLRNIEFLPTIDYDEDEKYIVIKLEKEAKEFIRVEVNNPEKIKKKKFKKLFDSLTKSQKHCFIFLICCIISRKTPIIQGPTASGKSYLLNVFSKLLGQDPNLYQMNSNTGMSILTGQEIIKEEFDIEEKKEIKNAYKSIKKIINYEELFNSMSLREYKRIISKIDETLKTSDNLDEKTKEKLKKARRTIFVIISPPSRFIHKDSVFTDSILENNGKWVILDGIEMAPSEIPEKIAPLCGENPEISIFESGKEFYITSKDIKENFHLFIIYNPFNKGSKIIDQILFNKCVSFTLPSIDISQLDSSSVIYNSIKISKKANKNIWNILSSKLAASHITATLLSEKHLEQMAGGIKITPRNLIFLITDRNKNNFDDSNLDETLRWIKSSLAFYYFNSFIDAQKEKKKRLILSLMNKEK